jgi:hypothetical protein
MLHYLVGPLGFLLSQMLSAEAFRGGVWVPQFVQSRQSGLDFGAAGRQMALHAVGKVRLDFKPYPFLGRGD